MGIGRLLKTVRTPKISISKVLTGREKKITLRRMEMSDENTWDYSGIERKTGFDAFSHRSLCPRECSVVCRSQRRGYCQTGTGFHITSICEHTGKEPILCETNMGSVTSFLLTATSGVSTARTTRLVVTRERSLADDSRLMKSSLESKECSLAGSEVSSLSPHRRHSADESNHHFLISREQRWK